MGTRHSGDFRPGFEQLRITSARWNSNTYAVHVKYSLGLIVLDIAFHARSR